MESKQKTETAHNGVRRLRTIGLFVLPAAAILSQVGCSKDPAGGTDGDRTAITVSATLPVGAAETSTKGVADGSTALTLSFARADATSAGTYGAYGAEFTGTRAAGTGGTALTFDPVQYYLTNGLKTRIIGWYPGGATAAGGAKGFYDASAGKVSWTIDGGQDILLAAPREGSKTAEMPVFEFRHALAQLQFSFYAESETALVQWGKIRGVAVRGQRAAAAFTPAAATVDNPKVTFTGDATETFAAANFAEMTAPVGTETDAVGAGGPVMIEPQETPCRLTVEVTTEKRGVQTAVVSGRAYAAGQAVKICIRLAEHSVMIDPGRCVIVPWSAVGQTGDNEMNDVKKLKCPYVRYGNTVMVRDGLVSADPTLYPTHAGRIGAATGTESTWDANGSHTNTCAEKLRVAKSDAVDMDGRSTMMSWYEASGTTQAALNPSGYSACAAYSEETDGSDRGLWHLPTVRELKLIYDKRGELTAANISSAGAYWAATTYTQSALNAWSVNFATGLAFSDKGRTDDGRVRCVRDMVRLTISSSYPKVEDGLTIVVRDDENMANDYYYPTHLRWPTTPEHMELNRDDNRSGLNSLGMKFRIAATNVKDQSGNDVTMNWYRASGTLSATCNPDGYSACSSYSERGDTDDQMPWRLPTAAELSLIWRFSENRTLNTRLEKDVHWSATMSNPARGAKAYATSMEDGLDIAPEKCNAVGRVRCVRDL